MGIRTLLAVLILQSAAVAQTPAPPRAAGVTVYDISSGAPAWRAGVTALRAAEKSDSRAITLVFEFSPSVSRERLAADLYAGERRLNANQLQIVPREDAGRSVLALPLDAQTFDRLLASPEAQIVTGRFRIALAREDIERLRLSDSP